MKKAFNNSDFFISVLKELEKGNKVSFLVKGNSMSPFLVNGKTEVFLKKNYQLKRYEIYLFKYHDKFILHRYIGKKKDNLIFRGDNNNSLEYVSEDSIIANVYQFQINGKTINTNQFFYKFRVRCFIVYRVFRSFIKKILKR